MRPLKIIKGVREEFRDFYTEHVTMMMRKMMTLNSLPTKLMRLLSTYLRPQTPVPGSQMDTTKACDRLMCVHIK